MLGLHEPAERYASAGPAVVQVDDAVKFASAPRRLSLDPLSGLYARRTMHIRHCHRSSSDSEEDMAISPEEYQALPASIRKKYFSPDECLQIARKYAAEQRKRQIKKSWLDSPTPSPVQSTLRPLPSTAPKTSATPRRHRSSRLTSAQRSVSEDEALWFLSLPEKVKRRQFSREEQVLLTDLCERTLRGSSAESASELSCQRLPIHREECSHCALGRRSLPSAAADEETIEANTAPADTLSLSSVDADDEDEMAILNLYSKRNSAVATCASIPPPPAASMPSEQKPEQKKSFRRSFALKPIPLPAPTLAPVPPHNSPTFFDQRPTKLRRHRTEPTLSLPKLSPDAKYYQDPETRKTLQTLASPQKFDEAIEFGFPPAELQRPPLLPSPELPDHTRSYSLTFSSSEDEDYYSIHSPATPTEAQMLNEPTITRFGSSVDSGASLPLQNTRCSGAKTPESRRSPSLGNREMTLRMTLTRPDLRAPDEWSGWLRERTPTPVLSQEDPLALEPLPVCDDPSGLQGAFAVREDMQSVKGVKKVWKSLRGR